MITIPEHLWNAMLQNLSKEKREVEQVCYFDGVLLDSGGVVTTVTIPNAKLEPGHFHVEPASMSEAGKHLRVHKIRRLAQVHTHPTEWTGHSAWDNAWAYSQISGALSIVLPDFGRIPTGLTEVGVHLRTERGWQHLTSSEVAQHLRIIPSLFDFRSNNEPARIEPTRKRSWWSFLTFWRRQ